MVGPDLNMKKYSILLSTIVDVGTISPTELTKGQKNSLLRNFVHRGMDTWVHAILGVRECGGQLHENNRLKGESDGSKKVDIFIHTDWYSMYVVLLLSGG